MSARELSPAMSGDQPASRFASRLLSPSASKPSFGDHPNAQPPTPKQTPTSAIFPSPVFETPKQNQSGRFDDSSGWTPRFAEEYSVFNATPGNLRASRATFPDFVPSTSFGVGHKRQLSVEGVAAEIASHVNHFSPTPLPPVEPSKQLKSSTGLLATPGLDRRPSTSTDNEAGSAALSVKKVRLDANTQDSQGQTATPPPSAHKGGRKLGSKLDNNEMQNDQGFGQPDFQQAGMGTYVTAQGEMFSYPLSAPATGQGFWDNGMDIDFGVNGSNPFQAPNSATQPLSPADWARANQQLLQQTGVLGQDQQMGNGDHTVVSQSMQSLGTSAGEQSVFVSSFPAPMEDPFGIVNNGVGVNPGLLFSRPPSSSMDMSFSTSMQMSNVPAPAHQESHQKQRSLMPKGPVRGELRRSASEKDIAPKRAERSLATSPIKLSARPGLTRSFSESRGKSSTKRASLPTLAPAPRPQSQSMNSGFGGRPIISQPKRPSGRSSPLKNQHHRLPSLSSIPETTGPRTRTEARFLIDANGRARVETTTTVIVDDDPPPTVRKRRSAQSITRHRNWNSSEEDDESSTDDEPIIIPSRTTSFALPDPRRPTSLHPFHNSQRSVSERSSSSYATFRGSQDDGDSDTETIINDLTPTANASGDAASELRKLRENRRGQLSTIKARRFVSVGNGPGTAGFAGSYNPSSPTTMTDTSLPTPSTGSRTRTIRCVCNRNEGRRGDGFMVQCEACDNYLHGQCVNVTEQTLSGIYICAFCANTTNMRGGRIPDNGQIMGARGGPRGSSPLAHKSFRSFR